MRSQRPTTKRGWAIAFSRQARVAFRGCVGLEAEQTFLLHAAECHVDRAAFEFAFGALDELEPVCVSVCGQQLQDDAFFARERIHAVECYSV